MLDHCFGCFDGCSLRWHDNEYKAPLAVGWVSNKIIGWSVEREIRDCGVPDVDGGRGVVVAGTVV